MYLLIDWGNTRLKFCAISALNSALVSSKSIVKVDVAAEGFDFVNSLKSLAIEQIVISSVRNAQDNQALFDALLVLTENIVFAKTTSKFGQLNCAYKEPRQLGVDRWLGMIAANEQHQSFGLISIGTAITLDIVKQNQHLGGQIIPGFKLLSESLRTTGQVKADAVEPNSAEFNLGQSTTECVDFGLQTLMIAYIECAINQSERMLTIADSAQRYDLDWIITGGGGQYWASQLSTQYRKSNYSEHLIFAGLIRYFQTTLINESL
ncbi:type III pantothenate kinase [Aliikangiella sp. IMCC44653]